MSTSKIVKAVKIVSRKVGQGRIFLRIVGDRLIYKDAEQSIEIGVQNSPAEIVYQSVEELEVYQSHDQSSPEPICREGRDFHAGILVAACEYCVLAIDSESTRYALGGVCWDNAHLVASDGRRLHAVRIGDAISTEPIIIPARAVAAIVALARLFGEDILSIRLDAANNLIVHGDCWRFSTRLVEGRFPNWRSLLDEYLDSPAIDSIPIAETRSQSEQIAKNFQLLERAKLKAMSRSEKKTYCPDTPQIRINSVLFDAEFIRDALVGMRESIVQAFGHGPNRPILIGTNQIPDRTGETLAVIMPLSK